MVVWEGSGVPSGCLRGAERHSQWSGRGREALPKVWKGLEALPEVQEGSGRLPGGSAVVGMPSRRSRRPWRPAWHSGMVRWSSRRSGRDWEAHLVVREGWGGPPGSLGRVGRPKRRSRRLSRRSERGQEALAQVREESGGPTKGPDGVRRDREGLPKVRKRSAVPSGALGKVGVLPRCPGGDGRPFQRSGCGWKTLSEVQEELGGPPGGQRGVGRPTLWSGRGREVLLEVQEDRNFIL